MKRIFLQWFLYGLLLCVAIMGLLVFVGVELFFWHFILGFLYYSEIYVILCWIFYPSLKQKGGEDDEASDR